MMKTAVLVGAFASMAMAEAVWSGDAPSGAVNSGGYWFKYDDNAETKDGGPGASTSTFPAGSTESDVIGPWVTEKGGLIDVDFTINASTYKYPFAGIGFNWAADDPNIAVPQTFKNFCVEYSLGTEIGVNIEIKNDPSVDGNNAYAVKLKPQATMAKTCYAVATFAQETGWGTKIPLDTAMAKSQGMKFKAQIKSVQTKTTTVNLKIKSIETDAVAGAIASRSVIGEGLKLSQMGRSLSINGLGKATAAVELINMQGQVVAHDVLSAGKVMNLSRVSNGIYIVRAQSGKVNFSKRITLQ